MADATRSDDEFYEPDGQDGAGDVMADHGNGAEAAEAGDAMEDHDDGAEAAEARDAMEDHVDDAEASDAMEDHVDDADDAEFGDAMEDHVETENAEDRGEDAMEDHDNGEDTGDGRDIVMNRHRSRLSTTSFEAPSEAAADCLLAQDEPMLGSLEVSGTLPEDMDDQQAMELSMILQQIHDLELGFGSEIVVVC